FYPIPCFSHACLYNCFYLILFLALPFFDCESQGLLEYLLRVLLGLMGLLCLFTQFCSKQNLLKCFNVIILPHLYEHVQEFFFLLHFQRNPNMSKQKIGVLNPHIPILFSNPHIPILKLLELARYPLMNLHLSSQTSEKLV
ncbi:hypothetical protein ACJX0J_021009, partial [Zea mays]